MNLIKIGTKYFPSQIIRRHTRQAFESIYQHVKPTNTNAKINTKFHYVERKNVATVDFRSASHQIAHYGKKKGTTSVSYLA